MLIMKLMLQGRAYWINLRWVSFFWNHRSSIMIDDSKKNESHRIFICNFRGPLRSSFFVCHRLDVTNKKKGVRISPCTNFFTMFIFTRTYLLIPIPYTCYLSKCLYFYILIFDTYFKIKKFISREVKIILPLMVRTYQVWQKLFLFNPGAQVLIQTRTYVC